MIEKLKWFGDIFSLLPYYPWYALVALVIWVPLTGYVVYLLTAGRPFAADVPRMEVNALYSDAIEVSRQILDFVTDRQRNEPAIDFDNWDESTRKQMEYSTETNNQYTARFGGKTLALRDEFRRHHLMDKELDRFVEHPTNYIGMRTVGMRLAALAHSLPSKKSKKK